MDDIRSRGIAAMHEAYGLCNGHACKECCNFVRKVWDKAYFKCAAYGLSNSTATDWAGKYQACGLFDIPFAEGARRMVDKLKHQARAKENEILAGQVGMGNLLYGRIEDDFRGIPEGSATHKLHD